MSIKKYIFLAGILFYSQTSQAQINIGIHAGLNPMNISGDVPSNSKYKSSGGYLVGANIDFRIADEVLLSLQPGLSQFGVNIQYLDKTTNLYEDSVKLDFQYTDLPVQLNIVSKNKRFYFSSGFTISSLLSATATSDTETDISDDLNPVNFAVNFGLTYLIPIGKPFLFIEARYAQGVTNITNIETEGSYIPRVKSSGWLLRTGIQFPLMQNPE